MPWPRMPPGPHKRACGAILVLRPRLYPLGSGARHQPSTSRIDAIGLAASLASSFNQQGRGLMKMAIRAGLIALAAGVLTACGGGGGGDSSSSGSPRAPSYWTMDAYTYNNGGHSAQSTNSVGGETVTTAVVSTATLSGGDTSNGAYSGSALSFVFKGTPIDGIYTLVPNTAAFVAADAATAPMLLEVTLGVAVNTGGTQYIASTGKVQVTRDGSGTYHFATVGPVATNKTIDVQGGVAGAPASMALTVYDAY